MPCFGHGLYITYQMSLQYLVHPCPSHTSPHSPRSTVCITSGKYNRFFHPHASVLTTELESFNSSKPKSTLSIWKNDLPNSSYLIWKQSMLKNSNNKTETNSHSTEATEATWNHSRHKIHKRSLHAQAFLKNKQYERPRWHTSPLDELLNVQLKRTINGSERWLKSHEHWLLFQRK